MCTRVSSVLLYWSIETGIESYAGATWRGRLVDWMACEGVVRQAVARAQRDDPSMSDWAGRHAVVVLGADLVLELRMGCGVHSLQGKGYGGAEKDDDRLLLPPGLPWSTACQ